MTSRASARKGTQPAHQTHAQRLTLAAPRTPQQCSAVGLPAQLWHFLESQCSFTSYGGRGTRGGGLGGGERRIRRRVTRNSIQSFSLRFSFCSSCSWCQYPEYLCMNMEYTSFVAFVAFGSFESLYGSVLCRSQSLTFLPSIDAIIHPYTNYKYKLASPRTENKASI